MKLKSFLIGLSIVANVLLGWQVLQMSVAGSYYQAGLNDKAVQYSNDIINQLNTTGELKIGTPQGDIYLTPKVNEQPEIVELED